MMLTKKDFTEKMLQALKTECYLYVRALAYRGYNLNMIGLKDKNKIYQITDRLARADFTDNKDIFRINLKLLNKKINKLHEKANKAIQKKD